MTKPKSILSATLRVRLGSRGPGGAFKFDCERPTCFNGDVHYFLRVSSILNILRPPHTALLSEALRDHVLEQLSFGRSRMTDMADASMDSGDAIFYIHSNVVQDPPL